MKLVNSKYGLDIQLEENQVTVLVVDNATTMTRIVNDLINKRYTLSKLILFK